MNQESVHNLFRLRSFASRGVDLLTGTVSKGAFDPHFHETYLIGFTLAGSEEFTQEGKSGSSKAGQVRIVPPGAVHTGMPGGDQPWRYLALYIDPTLIGQAEDELARPIFGAAAISDPALFDAGIAYAWALMAADEGARDSAEATLLLRLMEHRTAEPTVRKEPRKIALARDYIRHRMAATVRLDEIAAAVGLSKFHLLRTFKDATGLTPWRYQVQLRLATARELLREGTPASQVAVVCGFFDQSHFTRLFRASYGITPAAFAAAHRSSSRLPG